MSESRVKIPLICITCVSAKIDIVKLNLTLLLISFDILLESNML